MIDSDRRKLLDAQAKVRGLKKQLQGLALESSLVIREIDEEMAKPPSAERGSRLAKITNLLNFETDAALHFGLGLSFARIKRLRARLVRVIDHNGHGIVQLKAVQK